MVELSRIQELIAAAKRKGSNQVARDLIEQALALTPAGWKPLDEDEETIRGTFWDQDEFFAYVTSHESHQEKSIIWKTAVSFSKLWWQLAGINIAEERFDNALVCIAQGLELEPDHPVLWIERGYIFNRIGRHRDALEAYRMATTVRPWAPRTVTARALRGQGHALIELARFSEAKDVYAASLELDPESESAHKELEYIDQALAHKEKQAANLPWSLNRLQ
jgi:tetratricopeptide (TPR) repeat protein